jgi:hypothetical protein
VFGNDRKGSFQGVTSQRECNVEYRDAGSRRKFAIVLGVYNPSSGNLDLFRRCANFKMGVMQAGKVGRAEFVQNK